MLTAHDEPPSALGALVRMLLVIGILVLSACGDDDNASPPAAAPDPIAQLPTDTTVTLPGLGAATDVVFDELGMPHVFSPDDESALVVQGYLTASARFWEMDVFRRFAEGRLSEIFGRLALEADVGMRTEFTTRDGRRLEEALWEHMQAVDPDAARLLTAYATGVNAWLADLQANRNGTALPPEYSLFIIAQTASQLAPWRPQDTLAIARLEAWQLSETLDEELERAQVQAAVPDAVYRDVFRSAPAAPATVLPPITSSAVSRSAPLAGARHAVVLPANLGEIVGGLAALRRMAPFGSRAEGAGSNNWIVSPALSTSGHAMLANDPHLALYNPPIWHMIQLEAGPGAGMPLHANGVVFPGLPGVLLGNNDFGAWGATVSGFDVTDVYAETITTPPDYPSSPRTVLFKGQQVPVLRIEETFNVKGFGTIVEPIEVVPHHGPMVPPPNLSDYAKGLAATGMSFRWTGHEITNDVRFLIDLTRAQNVSDFRTSLQNFAVGGQNWVWADVHGDIAYFPRVLIPQRPQGTVPYVPMDGTGEAEWLTDAQGNTRWLPDDQIPQATNPAEGFLSTANNDQIGTTLDNDPLNDPVYLAYTFDLGFREQRIHELLSNAANVRAPGAKISPADMSAYQYDHSSKEAAELLPFLFAAAQARSDLVTPQMQAVLQRLQAWGQPKANAPPYDAASGVDAHDLRDDVLPRRTPVTDAERTDSVATSIFAAWETRLGPAVFDDDFAGTGVSSPGGEDATKALLHILKDVERPDAGFRVWTKGPDGQSTLWDNKATSQVETRDEMLLGALREALTFLNNKFQSAEPESWLWGLIHQVDFTHFLAQAGFHSFDLGPFAAPGARFTVSPGDYSLHANAFTFSGGASQRYVAVLDPAGIRAVNTLPGGQNGNPGDAASYNQINPEVHYGDLVPGWINGETFEYHQRRADVAAHAVRKVHFSP